MLPGCSLIQRRWSQLLTTAHNAAVEFYNFLPNDFLFLESAKFPTRWWLIDWRQVTTRLVCTLVQMRGGHYLYLWLSNQIYASFWQFQFEKTVDAQNLHNPSCYFHDCLCLCERPICDIWWGGKLLIMYFDIKGLNN